MSDHPLVRGLRYISRSFRYEIYALSACFGSFVWLRRDQELRYQLNKYRFLTPILTGYYWVEDNISHGQLHGQKLKQADLRAWYGEEWYAPISSADDLNDD